MLFPTIRCRIAAAGEWIATLYQQAGVGPADIDLLEVYDDYPVINVMQFEDLGFCGKGAGPTLSVPTPLEAAGTFPCTQRLRDGLSQRTQRGHEAEGGNCQGPGLGAGAPPYGRAFQFPRRADSRAVKD